MEKENQEKCIRQFVLIVAKNVKFHSNLTEADQYTAENAMQREDPQEEIDFKLTSQNLFSIHNLFLFVRVSQLIVCMGGSNPHPPTHTNF